MVRYNLKCLISARCQKLSFLFMFTLEYSCSQKSTWFGVSSSGLGSRVCHLLTWPCWDTCGVWASASQVTSHVEWEVQLLVTFPVPYYYIVPNSESLDMVGNGDGGIIICGVRSIQSRYNSLCTPDKSYIFPLSSWWASHPSSCPQLTKALEVLICSGGLGCPPPYKRMKTQGDGILSHPLLLPKTHTFYWEH